MKLYKKCFDNWFTQNHSKFYLPFKKGQKQPFSNIGQLGTKIVECYIQG